MISGVIQKVLNLIPFQFRTRVKSIPLLKHVQSFIINRYLINAEFNVQITGGPARGLIFPVKLPQDKQMWIGTWELDFAKALYEAIKPGFVCYDIGGYKGYYSGIMALHGASEVFVFEPMPQNAEKIRQLIALNPNLPILLKEYAVSENEGKAVFKIMQEETMGKLEASRFQNHESSINEFIVQCVSIDGLISEGMPVPDFIKIDVEGAEELVLKGAIKLLHSKRPLLMIEIHSSEIGKRCLAILENLYSNIKVFETGLHPNEGAPEICHYIVSN
jgi:FkbM family methyltransferase